MTAIDATKIIDHITSGTKTIKTNINYKSLKTYQLKNFLIATL